MKLPLEVKLSCIRHTFCVQKAKFHYNADFKPQSMDNKISNGFDRSYAYDFAGRLSSNQFGSSYGRQVYGQTVAYDAFSQITNRSTVYWGSSRGFGATYTNGRKTGGYPIPTYDAAGHILDTTGSSTNYDRWTFDAAGRLKDQTSRNQHNSGGFAYIERTGSGERYCDM